jgi:serine/threonine-protein kinase HipA
MTQLVVLLDGERIGIVEQSKGQLALTYDRQWTNRSDSYPLSLSMPLSRETHHDDVVRPFLEGLLPDNQQVLERWGKQLHVSPRNPFALLARMGEDCAGAVQIAEPDRVGEITEQGQHVDWLTEEEVGQLLKDLVEHHGTGRPDRENGHFSLAGAQPKTALFHDGQRWGIPRGRTPTTHIIKPPAQRDLAGLEVNEHFCLRLANRLGLATAESRIESWAGRTAIVVKRYDRYRDAEGMVRRMHQEDMCQALAVPPWTKYENEGGPGVTDLIELLLRESSDPAADVGALVDALALSWAIAGTDAHAKNFSMLLSPGSIRLAPLYDLISSLPYDTWLPYRKAKLAMRVGREYYLWKIRGRHWVDLAERCDLDPEPVLARVLEVARAIPGAAHEAAASVRADGLPRDFIDRLESLVIEHSITCAEILEQFRLG